MRSTRRQQILEVLATELEVRPGSRITTASLARAVGVSEAALYRHFPSKTKMFECLLDFAEEAVFGLIGQVLSRESSIERQCFQIGSIVLGFAEKNPGIARILMGDILLGEHERLRQRVVQFFARLETQYSQLLRDYTSVSGSQKARAEVPALANLITAVISGRLAQYVRTEFAESPSTHWNEQWRVISNSTFS